MGSCLRNPLRDQDSGEPSISRAAATFEKHALGEESVDLFLRRPAVAFDRLVQSSELLANDLRTSSSPHAA